MPSPKFQRTESMAPTEVLVNESPVDEAVNGRYVNDAVQTKGGLVMVTGMQYCEVQPPAEDRFRHTLYTPAPFAKVCDGDVV